MNSSNSKTIVAYCTGGLGNRLIPLSQCAAISKQSGRELLVYWDTTDPHCRAPFDALFQTPLHLINQFELESLREVSMYCEGQANHCYECEDVKWKRPSLRRLAESGAHAYNRFVFSFNNPDKNIIIHQDGAWYPNVNRGDAYEFLRHLLPTDEILEKIEHWQIYLDLTKKVTGVHVRGTDFPGATVEPTLLQMSGMLQNNSASRFLVVTDDLGFQRTIHHRFPGCVNIRPQDVYIRKTDPDNPWGTHNFERSTTQLKDAVLDMYLLALTDIKVYHPNSSFCNLARILSGQE